MKSLKLGVKLILKTFHVRQLTNYSTSGEPKQREMLFTKEILQQDFADLK